jgi:aromatic ring hydroxylase
MAPSSGLWGHSTHYRHIQGNTHTHKIHKSLKNIYHKKEMEKMIQSKILKSDRRIKN